MSLNWPFDIQYSIKEHNIQTTIPIRSQSDHSTIKVRSQCDHSTITEWSYFDHNTITVCSQYDNSKITVWSQYDTLRPFKFPQTEVKWPKTLTPVGRSSYAPSMLLELSKSFIFIQKHSKSSRFPPFISGPAFDWVLFCKMQPQLVKFIQWTENIKKHKFQLLKRK